MGHFGAPHSPKTGPQIKNLVKQTFGHGKVSKNEAPGSNSTKNEGGLMFSIPGLFRALLGHNLKTGARIKILVHNFLVMVS